MKSFYYSAHHHEPIPPTFTVVAIGEKGFGLGCATLQRRQMQFGGLQGGHVYIMIRALKNNLLSIIEKYLLGRKCIAKSYISGQKMHSKTVIFVRQVMTCKAGMKPLKPEELLGQLGGSGGPIDD